MKRQVPNTISFLVFLLFFFKIVAGQEKIGEIKIANNEKNITNLSGPFNDSISFHLIINKTAEKSFKASINFFDVSNESKTIVLNESQSKPIFLAFHINNNVLTLTELLENSVKISDIHYDKGTVKTTELKGIPQNILSHPNITILNFSKSLDLAFIRSSQDIKRNKLKFAPGFDRKNFINPDLNKTDFIDDTKLITEGFIKDFKAFYINKELVLVNDFIERNTVNILNLKPEGILSSKRIEIYGNGKLKQLGSFIKNNKLFTFHVDKEGGQLSIYDLKSLVKKRVFEYNSNDFGQFNSLVFNGERLSESNLKPKRFLRGFSPQTVGSAYNPALYLNVNETYESGYIIEVGHLDKNTHVSSVGNYWWGNPMFNNQLKTTNNNATNSMSAMAGMAQMSIFNALAESKRRGNYFKLHLNTNLNPIDDNVHLKYEKFQKRDYQYLYQNKLKLKREYFIPLRDRVRLINYENDKYSIYDLKKV